MSYSLSGPFFHSSHNFLFTGGRTHPSQDHKPIIGSPIPHNPKSTHKPRSNKDRSQHKRNRRHDKDDFTARTGTTDPGHRISFSSRIYVLYGCYVMVVFESTLPLALYSLMCVPCSCVRLEGSGFVRGEFFWLKMYLLPFLKHHHPTPCCKSYVW